MTVYVLTMLEGNGKNKAWRPVAVVSNPGIAEQYYSQWGPNAVDWVPLELDDVANIGTEKGPSFHPRTPTPGEDTMKELREETVNTVKQLQEVIKQQSTLIKKLQKGQKSAAGDKVPPRPTEGGKAFPDILRNGQEIADYVETYSTYPVDNEFVYELYRGAHAVLKLLPIAKLREGGRDHNQQSKANEDKFLKQDLKTQPPVLVEDGEVKDGNHRLRANKRRGLTHMWCYVVIDGESNGDTDEQSGS